MSCYIERDTFVIIAFLNTRRRHRNLAITVSDFFLRRTEKLITRFTSNTFKILRVLLAVSSAFDVNATKVRHRSVYFIFQQFATETIRFPRVIIYSESRLVL